MKTRVRSTATEYRKIDWEAFQEIELPELPAKGEDPLEARGRLDWAIRAADEWLQTQLPDSGAPAADYTADVESLAALLRRVARKGGAP